MSTAGPISVITGTVSDDALHGPCDVWGVMLDGSSSGVAVIQLHNNISFTGTVLVQLATNIVQVSSPNTTEKFSALMFPQPIRFSRALSITADAGVGRYWILIGGRAGASV